MENKGSNVRYNKINITFPDMVIVENIIPRNMIINLGCASVDNHIPRDDIYDYHHIREGNIYIIFHFITGSECFFSEIIIFIDFFQSRYCKGTLATAILC